MQYSKGFTLGELAVTMAVVAVIVTVGLPSLGNFISDHRLARGVNLMVTDIQHARTAALNHHTRVIMCPTHDEKTCLGEGDWDSGWMIFTDANHSGKPESEEAIIRVNRSDSRLSIRSGNRHRIRYQPDGTAPGSNLSLVACDDRGKGAARTIVVSNPGRVRSQGPPDDRDCSGIPGSS